MSNELYFYAPQNSTHTLVKKYMIYCVIFLQYIFLGIRWPGWSRRSYTKKWYCNTCQFWKSKQYGCRWLFNTIKVDPRKSRLQGVASETKETKQLNFNSNESHIEADVWMVDTKKKKLIVGPILETCMLAIMHCKTLLYWRN